MSSAGLFFTGHALVDVGIAGLCAHAKKKAPELLTLDDLDGASESMKAHYYDGKLNAYLSCVFMNASFVQPNEGQEKRDAFIRQYLFAHRAPPHPDVAGQRCAFSGLPATSPLVRTHLPLFSGEGVLNFRPNGTTWVPAAGPFVTALFFLPMASRKAEGRLLAVWTEDPDLTIAFARRFLTDNERLLSLTLPSERAVTYPGYDREQPGWDAQKKKFKYADVKGPRSLVVDELMMIAAEAGPDDLRSHAVAVTGYLLSSSGQGPSLDIFEVPSGVAAFVIRAAQAETRSAWRAIQGRYNPVSGGTEGEDDGSKKKRVKKKDALSVAGRAGWSRNPAFENLCAIFDAGFTDRDKAASWLRKHVLVRIESKAGDVRYGDGRARSWLLAELFLTEVLGMEKTRIEAIRRFADKVAECIEKKNKKDLWRALAFRKPHVLQSALRRAQRDSASGELLFGLDEYAALWLHEDKDKDAFLVRDLLAIRVVEKLHERGWFTRHPEENPDLQPDQLQEEVQA